MDQLVACYEEAAFGEVDSLEGTVGCLNKELLLLLPHISVIFMHCCCGALNASSWHPPQLFEGIT